MIIRAAAPTDLAAITDIYARHVLSGTGTFEEVAPSQTEMAQRMAEVQGRALPWLVGEAETGRVAGYAYAGPFRTRTAYRFTLEDSVYVAAEFQGQGVGRALLSAVLEACAVAGYRQMLALIGDSQNAVSNRTQSCPPFRFEC